MLSLESERISVEFLLFLLYMCSKRKPSGSRELAFRFFLTINLISWTDTIQGTLFHHKRVWVNHIDNILDKIWNPPGGTPPGISVSRLGEDYPNCGQTIPWVGVSGWIKRRNWWDHQHSSLSVSSQWMQHDQLPHIPATMISPPWWTVPSEYNQNKPFLPSVALARYFVAATRE